MKIIKWLLAVVLALSPSLGMAQNGFFTDRAVGVSQFNGFSGLVPISYGQVRICTSADITSTTTPCPNLASVFDINGNALTVSGGNFGQLTTDVVGRFNGQAAPGSYRIQVAATGSNTPQLNYVITVSSSTLAGGFILNTNNFWTGTNTFTGNMKCKNFEGIRCADQFASIQAAITDAGTTGAVLIPPTYPAESYVNSNNIFIQDLRKSTYANLLKFSTFGLALNSGSTLNFFGDSITVGQGTTTPATDGYAPLLASSMGMVVNNQAVSGSQVQDAGQIDAIYATSIGQTSNSFWLPAYNDMRLNGTGATPLATAKNTIFAGALHLAVPDAYRVSGSSVSCTRVGAWTGNAAYSGLGVFSTTNGNTLSCAGILGTSIYVVGIAASTGGGQMTVSVDGIQYGGTYSLFTFAASNAGRTYSPFVVRVPNLPSGSHTVLITVVSATNVANSVNVVEVVGNGGRDYAGPNVYIGKVLHMTAAGYAAGAPFNAGSDGAVDAYNAAIEDVCRQLTEDGFGVVTIDTSRYNPATDVSADNIHPSNLGAQHIVDSSITATSGGSETREKAAAVTALGRRSVLPFYAAQPGNYGMWVGCPDATDCQIATNRDPSSAVNLNPALLGGAINTDSSGNTTIYSTSSGGIGIPTRQFRVESAGGISISATGTRIANHLSGTGSVDFAAWAGNDCQDLTVTVTGAADGNTIVLGIPNGLASTAGIQFTGFVSAANTVTVRGCKVTAGASANPAATTVRADVWQH